MGAVASSWFVQVQPSSASLIMTEPMFNLASIQLVTQEVAFEHFGFQAMHAAPSPELAMHAWAAANPDDPIAQSLSGVVVDAGYSFTHAVPIFDGRIIKPAARRIRVGGKLLTNLLKEWVRTQPKSCSHETQLRTAVALHSPASMLPPLSRLRDVQVSYRSMNLKDEPYLVEQVKEKVCYVATSADAEMARAFPKPRSQVSLEFVLPDGVHNERGYVQDPRDPAYASMLFCLPQQSHASFTQQSLDCMESHSLCARLLRNPV
jgi:actin-related protein 6